MASRVQDLNATAYYSPQVLLGCGVSLTVLTTIVVALRFYTRRRFRIEYGYDDWTILVALALCIGSGVIVCLLATIGRLGTHQQLGPEGQLIHTSSLTAYHKLRYANEILTAINFGVVKISVLLFYRRLFVVKSFRIASTFMIVLVTMWAISMTAVMIFQCVPMSMIWEKFETQYGSACVRLDKYCKAIAWSDLGLDIMVLALPIPFVCILHMPWQKKIAVIDVLLLNVIVLGSGIARLITTLQMVEDTSTHMKTFFFDITWSTAGLLFWIFAENSIAIIGACLPTLAPLWNKRAGATSSSSTSTPRKMSEKSNLTGSSSSDESEIGQAKKLTRNQGLTQVVVDERGSDDTLTEGIRVQTTFSVDRGVQI